MKRYLSELIGTAFLVIGGVGSAVLAGDKIGNVGVALAFGLSLLVMVYAIGPISGCHINPAVTLGAYLTGQIDLRNALAYAMFQFVGATVGASIVFLIASGVPGGYDLGTAALGANGYGSHSPGGYSPLSALVAEVVLTMLLVLTVLTTTDLKAPPGFAGLAIGLALVVIHLVSIPITNTSVNPARSFGPALIVGGWALWQLWLFVVAPLLGAVFAAATFRVIRSTFTLERNITRDDAEKRMRAA